MDYAQGSVPRAVKKFDQATSTVTTCTSIGKSGNFDLEFLLLLREYVLELLSCIEVRIVAPMRLSIRAVTV